MSENKKQTSDKQQNGNDFMADVSKRLSCYVAKNKGEFDVENMSFYKTKKKAKRKWGNEQEIKKITILFH